HSLACSPRAAAVRLWAGVWAGRLSPPVCPEHSPHAAFVPPPPQSPTHKRFQPQALALAPPPAKARGGREGVPRFELIPKAPLPDPPLPSQGKEPKLAAEAAPTRAGGGADHEAPALRFASRTDGSREAQCSQIASRTPARTTML